MVEDDGSSGKILGQLGRIEAAYDDEEIEPESHEHAEESPLLGQHGIHEVVVGHRQEPVAALRSSPEALP